MELLKYYEKKVIDTWKKREKDWFNIYQLSEEEIFEFLWYLRLIKGIELNGLSKTKVKSLANMIKKGKAPRDMNTYLKAMNKNEFSEEEKLSRYFYYRMS